MQPMGLLLASPNAVKAAAGFMDHSRFADQKRESCGRTSGTLGPLSLPRPA